MKCLNGFYIYAFVMCQVSSFFLLHMDSNSMYASLKSQLSIVKCVKYNLYMLSDFTIPCKLHCVAKVLILGRFAINYFRSLVENVDASSACLRLFYYSVYTENRTECTG
jgi:hypothetical protein